MAEPAAIRNMLQRVGFSNAAAILITGDQGIDSLDEIRSLDDAKSSNLCKILRRPGGTGAGGVADPGEKVSARAEDNLKLVIYYVKHQDRVSRTPDIGLITLASIRRLVKQQETEKNHTDPDVLPTIDADDWPKTMEAVEEYLRQFRGVEGTPLSYVVRQTLMPVAAATDPATSYPTLDEEMIARAPILEPTAAGVVAELEANGPFVDSYMTDRTMAWDKIANIFQAHQAWTYAKSARRSRNARKGYFGIYNHYLGPNNVDHMASKAERCLQATCYRGETKGWNFEKYVTLHKEQHHILEGLERHGYKGIDDRSKVRYLNDGIKTTKLDTIKAAILASTNRRSDFDGCVTLYKDFITQSGDHPDLKIAGLSTDDGSNKDGGGRDEDVIEDRYYSKDEYRSLTNGQKNYLRLRRNKRKGSGGETSKAKGSDGKTSKSEKGDTSIATLKSEIATLEAQIAALHSDEGDEASDVESDEHANDSNRKHSALTRQRKKAKKS